MSWCLAAATSVTHYQRSSYESLSDPGRPGGSNVYQQLSPALFLLQASQSQVQMDLKARACGNRRAADRCLPTMGIRARSGDRC
jgi:hypothetical protein